MHLLNRIHVSTNNTSSAYTYLSNTLASCLMFTLGRLASVTMSRVCLARKPLRWDNHVEVADELFAKFPNTDPLTLKFTNLQKMICELEKFVDDPNGCNESKLERIQMEWLDLFSDH